LFGFLELSLDNKPKTAIVIKKKAVAYTNNFNVNIMMFNDFSIVKKLNIF
jgi:hypothetical protein